MLNVELTNLRKDFDSAITSNRNVVTLDPSIADLRAKISQTDFVESCSIYSRSQLRKMNDWLGRISNARLKADPMAVAMAVGAVRQLLDDLEFTMRHRRRAHKQLSEPTPTTSRSNLDQTRITAVQNPAARSWH
jgi:hypothetical protein